MVKVRQRFTRGKQQRKNAVDLIIEKERRQSLILKGRRQASLKNRQS